MHARYKKADQSWAVTSVQWDHNHQPFSKLLAAFNNRMKDLIPQMKTFMENLLSNNISPTDVHRAYTATYPYGHVVTLQDLANLQKVVGCRGGNEDAKELLNRLHVEATKDPQWFIMLVAMQQPLVSMTMDGCMSP